MEGNPYTERHKAKEAYPGSTHEGTGWSIDSALGNVAYAREGTNPSGIAADAYANPALSTALPDIFYNNTQNSIDAWTTPNPYGPNPSMTYTGEAYAGTASSSEKGLGGLEQNILKQAQSSTLESTGTFSPERRDPVKEHMSHMQNGVTVGGCPYCKDLTPTISAILEGASNSFSHTMN